MDATATEAQIDAAARYLRETLQAARKLTSWDATPKRIKKKWVKLAIGTLAAANEAV